MTFEIRQKCRNAHPLKLGVDSAKACETHRRCYFLASRIVLCLSLFVFFFMPQKNVAAQDVGALDAAFEALWTTQKRDALSGPQKQTWAKQFELSLSIGIIPNDSYYNYFPIAIDLGYHFTQRWALSLRAALSMAHSDTTLKRFLTKQRSGLDIHRLGDEQLAHFDLYASFFPIYGKWSAGNYNLGHFSWGLLAGLGLVLSKECKTGDAKTQITPYFEGIVGTQIQWHLLAFLALRFEASLRIYQNHQGFKLPAALKLGLVFTFPQQSN